MGGGSRSGLARLGTLSHVGLIVRNLGAAIAPRSLLRKNPAGSRPRWVMAISAW
jgi:hypothetical protein